MTSLTKSVLSSILLIGVLGCGSDATGPSSASMTGTWGGRASKNGVAISVWVQLVQEGDSVVGTGSIDGIGGYCNMAITGDRRGESFGLSLKCAEFAPFVYSGKVHANRITGTFGGSGLPSLSLELARRPE